MRFLPIFLGLLLWVAPCGAQKVAYDYSSSNQTGKSFANQDLSRVKFPRSILRHANFQKAKMISVILNGSDMTETDFRGANLTGALLINSKLINTKLDGAILIDAITTGAIIKGASIVGADFYNAVMDSSQVDLLCKTARGVNPITKRNTRQTLNCPS